MEYMEVNRGRTRIPPATSRAGLGILEPARLNQPAML